MLKPLKNVILKIVRTVYVNSVAVMTIALSVFITATFGLFLLNSGDIADSWKKGIRVMAYLADGMTSPELAASEQEIRNMSGVEKVEFVSRDQALEFLRASLRGRQSLLADLKENPLPDSFEIRLSASLTKWGEIEKLAGQIGEIENITEVEYGKAWLERFVNILKVFQFSVFGIAGLFFMASVFIIANTIRLMLYTRREEIEIMRLVGASESFIKKPFFAEGIILGAVGGIIGLSATYLGYLVISSRMIQEEGAGFIQLRFFPPGFTLIIILCTVFIGWLGCSLSLSRFLKKY